jgi:predicted ester cyclase
VGEVVASDHVHHLPDRDVRGPDGVRRMVTNLRTAFPDLVFRLDDVVVGADKVAVRWTAHGTHEGPLGDLEATGRRVTWTGIDIVRVLDGRIVELWASPDAMGLDEQLTAAESPSSR